MTGIEMFFGVIAGIIFLLAIISILTFILTKMNVKEINSMRNVYLGKLANSDSSIENAMKYIKLTNGLRQYCDEEEK